MQLVTLSSLHWKFFCVPVGIFNRNPSKEAMLNIRRCPVVYSSQHYIVNILIGMCNKPIWSDCWNIKDYPFKVTSYSAYIYTTLYLWNRIYILPFLSGCILKIFSLEEGYKDRALCPRILQPRCPVCYVDFQIEHKKRNYMSALSREPHKRLRLDSSSIYCRSTS